jgi:hypothetical protein
MDQRIESFLADVLALAGKEPDAIREEVRFGYNEARSFERRNRTGG